LKEYARIRRKEIVLSRKNILKRDNHTCQYCGKKSVPMTIDHIISRNKGGGDSWDNLVAACVPCNTKKGNLSLRHIQMDLSKIPRKPTMILHLQKFVKQFQSSWRPYLFMQDKN
jgi:5-methylcytosine-specific restriction endonuclease McrA